MGLLLTGCKAPEPPKSSEPAISATEAQSQSEPDEGPVAEARQKLAAEKPPEPEPPPPPAPDHLKDPSLATRMAPDRYTVRLDTTKGELHIDVRRDWAPLASDRFYNLVRLGFFEQVAFFRVLDGFIAQTGLHGDPGVNQAWQGARIKDDPKSQSNIAGMVAFAASGPDTRTTQIFINLSNNAGLDRLAFTPFGRVRELDVARKLHSGYGEGQPSGLGPSQSRIVREGNAHLRREFPNLDYVEKATIVSELFAPVKQRPLPIRKHQ